MDGSKGVIQTLSFQCLLQPSGPQVEEIAV